VASLAGGRSIFAHYCADCHGADARGVEGRGVDLIASAFVGELDDRELTEYLREGRAADDPRNRTGQAMPGMELFVDFGDQNYARVIAYLRQIRGERSPAAAGGDETGAGVEIRAGT
jgi:mono/diheme cytochrome c family protein